MNIKIKPLKLNLDKPKRKKPVLSSSRSLKLLRDAGYIAEVVEKNIPHTFIKKDFIGCIDIIAFHEGKQETIGVQVTTDTGGQMSKHFQKIMAEPRILKWLRAGNKMVIHAWAKKGKAGTRKLFTLRERHITVHDFKGGEL